MSKYVTVVDASKTAIIADSSHTINDTLFVDCLIKATDVTNASTPILNINVPGQVSTAQLGYFNVGTEYAPSNSAAIKTTDGVSAITLAGATAASTTYNVQGWVKLS